MREMGHILDLVLQATAAHSRDVMYNLHLLLLTPDGLNDLSVRLIARFEVETTRDWPSWLLEIIPVRGRLDYRCFLGALPSQIQWRSRALSGHAWFRDRTARFAKLTYKA